MRSSKIDWQALATPPRRPNHYMQSMARLLYVQKERKSSDAIGDALDKADTKFFNLEVPA